MAVVKPFSFVPLHESPLLATADVVMALLKHTRVRSLAELYEKIAAEDEAVLLKLVPVRLSDAQLSAIETHEVSVGLLRTTPTANLTACTVCGVAGLVSGLPSKKCNLTLGCEGSPEKSGIAKKKPVVAGSED